MVFGYKNIQINLTVGWKNGRVNKIEHLPSPYHGSGDDKPRSYMARHMKRGFLVPKPEVCTCTIKRLN